MVLELLLQETDELMEMALRQATDVGFDLSSTRLSLTPSMLSALQEMRAEVDTAANQDEEKQDLLVSTGAVATLSLTAGFVTWLLRTGSLLATVLSTSPLWRPFDPIPVLVDLNDASRPDLGKAIDEA
jgi:phage host-nuclease inhibitor protein Gam